MIILEKCARSLRVKTPSLFQQNCLLEFLKCSPSNRRREESPSLTMNKALSLNKWTLSRHDWTRETTVRCYKIEISFREQPWSRAGAAASTYNGDNKKIKVENEVEFQVDRVEIRNSIVRLFLKIWCQEDGTRTRFRKTVLPSLLPVKQRPHVPPMAKYPVVDRYPAGINSVFGPGTH